MTQWKKPKQIYRVVVRESLENLAATEDLLVNEVTADTMTDFYAFYNWLYDDDWEVVDVQHLDVYSWKEVYTTHRWRGFYTDHHLGEHLHV